LDPVLCTGPRTDTLEEIVKLRDALSWLLFSACIMLVKASASAGEIRGKVVTTAGGEALSRVEVALLEPKLVTTTGPDGTFKIANVPAGRYTLRVAAVGYRLLTVPLVLAADSDEREISISLAPGNLRRTEQIEVKGDPFHGENPAVASQFNLNAQEVEEASTVLLNDPFRSVQALPGVAPSNNNDFFGQFSVLGAPFSNVSVYVDDVLVPEPFHGIPNRNDGASLSLFTADTLESLDLMPLAFPERYADSTGAALALRTREGSRTRPTFTASVGVADSDFIGEGELGAAKKGSWLVSARKSYLNYLVHSINGGELTDGSFEDGSVKLSYDVAPNQNLSFYFLDGHTDVTSSDAVTLNDLNSGGNDFTLARVGWRLAVTPRLLFDTQGAYIRQRYDTRNLAGQVLATDYYGEWLGETRTSWSWGKDQLLEAGFTGRRLRDAGFSQDFSNLNPILFSPSDATGLRLSGYAQQTSNLLANRLHLMAGLRWDHIEQVDAQPISAQASASMQVAKHTQVQFGLGRYAQFPSFQELALPCTFFPFAQTATLPRELYERSDHFTAAVEQRLGEYTRIRVEVFDRENHPIIGGRVFSPGGICGPVVANPIPAPVEPLFAPIRNYSRGVQLVIQRRSANRLSGWLGYTLDYARERVPALISMPTFPFFSLGPLFTEPTSDDQRHTVNAFATYRLTPSINLGGKWTYGSGFPVPGLGTSSTTVGNTVFELSNQTRLGDYQRLDLRLDKAWAYTRWKLTLYAEVLNITNHNNPRFIFTSFQANGQAFGVTDKGLPITPTAGLVFQF
jgi:hypothetical protein